MVRREVSPRPQGWQCFSNGSCRQRNEDPRLPLLCRIIRDITERKKSEQQLLDNAAF